MNGAPLTVNHGFPLRIVIPGIAGARWVKWLDTVTVQEHESTNFYMQRDYKILPPEVETRKQADDYWHKVKPMQGLPVNSAICRPESGDRVLAGRELEVAGYAMPQGDDGPVVQVEVSTDEGKTWEDATILFPSVKELAKPEAADKYKWCWAIWQYKMPADKTKLIDKATKIWSRATDAGGNMQTVEDNRRWNLRGVGYNGFGEVTGLKVLGSGGESTRQVGVGSGDGRGANTSESEKGLIRTSKL
jgi:sulfite oxidase